MQWKDIPVNQNQCHFYAFECANSMNSMHGGIPKRGYLIIGA